MPHGKAEHLSFLDKSTSATLLAILSDIEGSVIGDWWLTGSLSYRLRLPGIYFQQGLRDIDVALQAKVGQDPKALVKKDITKNFYVVKIDHRPSGGYYFRLVHKKSRIHVDIFTVIRRPELQTIMLDSISVATEHPEETLYHILQDIIRRDYNDRTIWRKTLNNANKLWSLVDQNELLLLLDKYHEEYEEFLPENFVFDDVRAVAEYALSRQAVKREQSVYVYPADCPATINGISIENEKTHRKALGLRSKRAEILKWYISRISNVYRR